MFALAITSSVACPCFAVHAGIVSEVNHTVANGQIRFLEPAIKRPVPASKAV